MSISRRELVEGGVAIGVALLTAPALGGAATPLDPTPQNELGPFYKKGAPATTNLIVPGEAGLPLAVSGKVLDATGKPLAGAILEVWQADVKGVYDLEGYRYRAQVTAAADGSYRFQTLMPGHYPQRVAQHIHYRVSAPGRKVLVTQLYFATDPAFAGDPDHNYSKDPVLEDRRLIRPVTLGEAGGPQAAVVFDTVLGS